MEGHSRVTYKGCLNYGKLKDQWTKVATPPPTASWTGKASSGAKEVKDNGKWINSKGKELLRDSILAGNVTRKSDPDVVHQSHPEYSKWPRANFVSNLKNLLDAVAFDCRRMAEDCEGYGHDIALIREIRKADQVPMSIPWHLSEAKPLLEKDMKDGFHKTMVPSALWESRIEYMKFDLKVFREHIYQETKRLEKLETHARFKKKKTRLPPPQHASLVNEAMLNLIEGAATRKKK
jgi:hypothetical protein